MRVHCAWCKDDLGEVPPFEDDRVTHGICRRCLEGIQAESREEPETVDWHLCVDGDTGA